MVNTAKPAESSSMKTIKTFAVLDLETANMPMEHFNRTAITELSIYAFNAQCLEKPSNHLRSCTILDQEITVEFPKSPRVLQKLTLLFNPRMAVQPGAEAVTGLSNYLLEHESPFDVQAADTLLGFLQHLQQPVCLVAHNGWNFDFPIVKQTLEKVYKQLPSTVLCVDSLRAFMEIDEKRNEMRVAPAAVADANESAVNEETTTADADAVDNAAVLNAGDIAASLLTSAAVRDVDFSTDSELISSSLEEVLNAEEKLDWRKLNETTPKRPIVKENRKRKSPEPEQQAGTGFKSRRALVFGESASPVHKKFPKKGVYKLGIMYQRVFQTNPSIAHHAEADVRMLMKLMLHYGEDFLAYAEQHAILFEEVKCLGAK